MGGLHKDSTVFCVFLEVALPFLLFLVGSCSVFGPSARIAVFAENYSVFSKICELVGSCSIFRPAFQKSPVSRVLDDFQQKFGSYPSEKQSFFELLA